MIDASGREIDIEVDGGVDMQNCTAVSPEAGATVLVAGQRSVYAEDPALAVRTLRGSEMKALLVASGIAPGRALFFALSP